MLPTTSRRYDFVLLLLYGVMINIFTLHSSLNIFSINGVDAITQVESIESSATHPDELSPSGWITQSLPDDWYENQRSNNQTWYRTQVSIPDISDDIWAVYLPSVTHNAAVYINGVWIGQGGSFDSPVSRHHNEPLLFSFSSELLTPGSNEIEIRVKAEVPMQGLMDQLYLAPQHQLMPPYQWKRFVRVELIQWITLGMYTLAAIILAFWIARPKDVIYGLFALQLAIWATHNLNLFVTEIPTSTFFWEAMTMSTLGWVVVLMIFFNHRYIGSGNKGVEYFIILFSICGLGLFLLPDTQSILSYGYKMWDAFLLVFGVYAISHLGLAHYRKPHVDTYLMLLAGIPILIFGFHDILLVNHVIDRREGLIIQYGVIPAIILFSWFLIRRFVQSLNLAEHLTETLEQRVQEKEREIQSQYNTLQTLESERVISEERERIMRDMHDGLGGNLVTLITTLQQHQGEIFNSLRKHVEHSLMDLRAIIDSMDPTISDLPTLLGSMRMRLMDQLTAAEIELEWAVTELPNLPPMTPQENLHIMRIVQEAVSNTVKHSNASKLEIGTGIRASKEAYIRISDNGDCFEIKPTDTGRGIKNMHYRAKQLNAKLDISSTDKGCDLKLIFLNHSLQSQ